MTAHLLPIGSIVETDVHSIGGRCETVRGVVVDHRNERLMIVQTEHHGRLAVRPDRARVACDG